METAAEVKKLKVEDLEQYGKNFLSYPEGSQKKIPGIFISLLKEHFGVLGMIWFFIRVLFAQGGVKREYSEKLKALEAIDKKSVGMITLFISMNKITDDIEAKTGRKHDIMGEFIVRMAKINMPLLYEVHNINKCEGDLFENFKKLNLSMFQTSAESGVCGIKEVIQDRDKQIIIIDSCDGCKYAEKIGWPEFAAYGCEHDLAGFPEVEKDLGMEFQRYKTIAKGDDICDFHFYRQGTAPAKRGPFK